jgi:phospholipid transport system substrate-binding protein
MRSKSAISFFRSLAAAGLLTVTAFYGISLARVAASSERFIENTIDQAYAILDRPLGEKERRRELQILVRSVADVRRIALFTVGRYVRMASERDIDHYVRVFEEYLVGPVGDILMEYRDRAIKVTGVTVRAPNDVIVNAEVAQSSGASGPIEIGFRVRKDESGREIIVDVYASGISLALIAKVAFAYFLFAHEEKLALLSEELIHRTDRKSGSVSSR